MDAEALSADLAWLWIRWSVQAVCESRLGYGVTDAFEWSTIRDCAFFRDVLCALAQGWRPSPRGDESGRNRIGACDSFGCANMIQHDSTRSIG